MPTANDVVQRLRRIGFEDIGKPGIPGDYRPRDERVPTVRMDAAFHLALSPELARRAHLLGQGSIYVHPLSESAPVELRDAAVIFATGPYVQFLSALVEPSGTGTTGVEYPAWCGGAAEALVAQLERQPR